MVEDKQEYVEVLVCSAGHLYVIISYYGHTMISFNGTMQPAEVLLPFFRIMVESSPPLLLMM
ncbi:hypothetical protein LguiA_009187 [Lonicera macranthoides]